jgi:hypothetical protein
MTSAPNLGAGIEDRDPPKVPNAVRVAETITISWFDIICSPKWLIK